MVKDENLIKKIAYLTDQIERLDIQTTQITLSFSVKEDEYDSLFIYFQNKHNRITQKPRKYFEINMGTVTIIINKNSV